MIANNRQNYKKIAVGDKYQILPRSNFERKVIKDIKEKDFLTYVMKIFIDIEDRCVSTIFTHLSSPYTAGLYLIDFYYSIPNRTNSLSLTIERWHRITKLINNQEMLYLVNIGFSDKCFASKEYQEKAKITLGAFIDWYYNPDFCYDEQSRNRILMNFSPYNQLIIDHLGFSIDDAVAFAIAHGDVLVVTDDISLSLVANMGFCVLS